MTFDEFVNELNIPGMEEFIDLVRTPDNIFDMLYPSIKQELMTVLRDPQTEVMLRNAKSAPEYKEISEGIPTIIAELNTLENTNPNKVEFITIILNVFIGDINDAEVYVEFIDKDEMSKLPAYAHLTDAGADIFVNTEMTIPAGAMGVIIPTGMKFAIPSGWQLSIRPRSGLSHKTQIRLSNAPGTIDSDYRDSVGIIVDNFDDKPFEVKKGDRLAQLILERVYRAKFIEIDDVTKIEGNRGGGYGSTGE